MEYVDFAASTPVVGPTPNVRRVRLGLGGNVAPGATGRADPAHTIAVAWQTDDGTLASELAWGADPDPSKWDAANRAQGVTWKTPPGTLTQNGEARMHEVYACGLTADTTYYYRVGGGPKGAEAWSPVYAFRTTPSDPKTKVTLALTGDSRGEEMNAWQLIEKRVMAAAPNAQLFSGDTIVLASDQLEWEKWLDRGGTDDAGKVSALPSILTLAAHGNHENHNTLFFANVTLPQDVAAHAKYAELFYSVDIGPVHVVAFDDLNVGSSAAADYSAELGAFLEADLTAADANRVNVPWVVTVSHHSVYSSSDHAKDKDVLAIRAFVTPIWDKHHVDLAINGHDHNYERSKPLTGPSDNPTIQSDPKLGTVYVVCAGTGADAYGSGTSSFTAVSHEFKNVGIGVYSFLTATSTSLTLDAHMATAAGDDPKIDSFTITK